MFLQVCMCLILRRYDLNYIKYYITMQRNFEWLKIRLWIDWNWFTQTQRCIHLKLGQLFSSFGPSICLSMIIIYLKCLFTNLLMCFVRHVFCEMQEFLLDENFQNFKYPIYLKNKLFSAISFSRMECGKIV